MAPYPAVPDFFPEGTRGLFEWEAGLEQGSARSQHALRLPTLLMTGHYLAATATASAAGRPEVDPGQLEEFFRDRLVILEWPADFEFLVSIDALDQLVGTPAQVKEQLNRLVTLSAQANIRIQLASGEYPDCKVAYSLIQRHDASIRLYVEGAKTRLESENRAAERQLLTFASAWHHAQTVQDTYAELNRLLSLP